MIPEGWTTTTIGDCLLDATTRNADDKFSHDDLKSVNKTLGMIPMKDRVKGKSVERAKIVKCGWFAYNPMRINVGSICRWQAQSDCIVSPDYVVFKCDEDHLLGDYLEHYRKSHRWTKFMEDAGSGSVRIRIYLNDLKQLACILPPLPEQQRIVEILSTWDQAIEATEKLIANSEAQKKALMQQLLTGKKRLPGFDGEWNPKTLDALGKTYTGLSGKTKADFGSGKPFVPYKNVFANAELDMNELEYVRLSDGEKQNLVKSGDIIFTTSSETPEEVGMSSAVLTDIGQLYLNSFCFGFRIKKQNEFTPSFAKHLFRSAELRRAISSLAQGSTRYNLSKNEFLKINIHLPKRAEQEQIVEVLDAVETVHAKEQMKLKKLKSEKSALMQQLLTGKRRVKIEEDIIA